MVGTMAVRCVSDWGGEVLSEGGRNVSPSPGGDRPVSVIIRVLLGTVPPGRGQAAPQNPAMDGRRRGGARRVDLFPAWVIRDASAAPPIAPRDRPSGSKPELTGLTLGARPWHKWHSRTFTDCAPLHAEV